MNNEHIYIYLMTHRDAVKFTSSAMLETNEMKREHHNNKHTTTLSSTDGAHTGDSNMRNEQNNMKKMKK